MCRRDDYCLILPCQIGRARFTKSQCESRLELGAMSVVLFRLTPLHPGIAVGVMDTPPTLAAMSKTTLLPPENETQVRLWVG
ncbi:hypothetical protein AES38_15170 (plasmid) [Clavibacter capsici]|nr:hypothetical protein AES38_15170 [Clavibacter capsici]